MAATEQQKRAIEQGGKVIVSASAGSGKTFVMIEKLVKAIENGTDISSVLAVTFTKKAAAQMKEKMRSALRKAIFNADADKKKRLKIQLADIQSADISTIHSFCAKMLRTYFYVAGIDGTFDIMAAEDAQAREYKERVLDAMFEKYYAEDNKDFKFLLSCYRKKRGDTYLKNLILSGYEELRMNTNYRDILDGAESLYTDEGFEKLCAEAGAVAAEEYAKLIRDIEKFAMDFPIVEGYDKIFNEMIETLKNVSRGGIFTPQCPLTSTRKPIGKSDDEKFYGEQFKKFRDGVKARYETIRGDFSDKQTEKEYFLKSGEAAKAFAHILRDFDDGYTQIKLDENKLDYNDLEHLTLKLLSDESIRREINAKYKCVFVDEYQDVNPVQEEIISRIAGEDSFFVGDAKQAIYGFRGSCSQFFIDKIGTFDGGDGTSLALSNNFRSSDKVLDFVNTLFTKIMTKDSCDFDYAEKSIMIRGGGYPKDYGKAEICIFGEDEDGEAPTDVYSVRAAQSEVKYSREALAVVDIVERELNSKHFDLVTGEMVDTKPGDICILTRKRNKSANAIVRALTDNGYSVAGAQGASLYARPEVKRILDILSYIDNKQQDIPLATTLLSPLGGLTYDELAAIRVSFKGAGRVPFRECCRRYIKTFDNALSKKLRAFRVKIERLRDMSEVFSAAQMIDKILEETYLEAEYSKGDRIRNIRRLAAEGENISVSALLEKVKSRYEISVPTPSSTDSIKIMTMHASKGLEFPIVIVADICATFKGRDDTELLFDKNYGFAHKCFDRENMLVHETLPRKLIRRRAVREELRNELNLFYVACTRAMCNLYVLAREMQEFNPAKVYGAKSYSELFDMSLLPCVDICSERLKTDKNVDEVDGGEYYEELCETIKSKFAKPYPHANSVNLPVKSSASAILRLSEEDAAAVPLFKGEGETGTEKGIAYHRFLELCNFSIKDSAGIENEVNLFEKAGLISAQQREILKIEELESILKIPVFSTLGGARLYREQEFLCKLPACEILPTTSHDDVLLQGAIDLLVRREKGYTIIDYKYSHKNAEELKATYSAQLNLYKKAVCVITGARAEDIDMKIINIFLREQIDL